LVLSAAGASRWQIIAPFLILAVLVSVLVGVITMSLMPQSLSVLRVVITAVRADLISNVIQPGRFSTPERGITFHIGARTPQGDLLGLLVDDRRDPAEHITYIAERGRIVRTDAGTFLVMEQGSVQRQQDDQVERTQIVVFDRYLVDIAKLSDPNRDVMYKPRERSMGFLFSPDPEDPYFKAYPGRFRSELHERLSSPLLPILLVFVALANVGFARTTREGRGFGTAAAICAAAGSIMLIVTAKNLAQRHGWAVPFLYGVPLSVIAITVPMAFGKFRRRHASALVGSAAFAATWVGERVIRASRVWVRP
jgi:lipopolysaccharide export system permease protein